MRPSAHALVRIRVWASEVRDRAEPHEAVTDEQVALAGALCSLLDVSARLMATNVRSETVKSIALIVGELVLSDVAPPSR